jgi:hypothetical protein
MSMQITIFGLVIGTIYSWIVIGLLIVFWYPLRRWRFTWVPFVAVGLVAIVAPWAEEYWIASRFEELCKGAGVHVYRTVEVEGFYDDTGVVGENDLSAGWTYLEYRDPVYKDVRRIQKNDGRTQTLHVALPTARYHYRHAYQPTPYRYEESVAWKVERTEWQVVDSQSSEVLGRETKYSRYPAVVDAIWMAPLFGSGRTTCKGSAPKPPETRHSVFKYVLIPKNAN